MLQSELLEFLDETADAAFCVSQQGDICSWNLAAEQLFGYSASEAIGKSCYGLLQCRGSLGATREFYDQQVTAERRRIPNFDLGVTFVQPHSPNRSKTSFAYFRRVRILPESPTNLRSACKHSATIFITSTTSLETHDRLQAVMHAMHRKLI